MTEYFKEVRQIRYEGCRSDNPLAFKYYNPEEVVAGKKMEDHLRFAVAYWHAFQATGTDPFGVGTVIRTWDKVQGYCKQEGRFWGTGEVRT